MDALTDQSRLALEYQATGSTDAISQLFESLRKFMVNETRKAYSVIKNADLGHCVDFDDLFQDAYFVLAKAASTYDHRAGANFFTHLHNFHLAATLILRASKKYSFFGQSWQVLERKSRLGKVLKRRNVRQGDSCVDSQVEEKAETSEEHRKFVEFISRNMDARDMGIIIDRFRDGKKLEEIGKSLSITRERVRQLESRALRKINESYPMFFFEANDRSKEPVCDPVESEVKYFKAIKAFEDSTGARIPSSVSPSKLVSLLAAALNAAGLGESNNDCNVRGHGGQLAGLS